MRDFLRARMGYILGRIARTVVVGTFCAGTVFVSTVFVSTAAYASSPWPGPVVTAALESTESALMTDRLALITVQLQPRWVAYWRSPGFQTLPTRLGIDREHEIFWPAPTRLRKLGIDTFGYQNTLPLLIGFAENADPNALKNWFAASPTVPLRFLACEEICVPIEIELTPTLRQNDDADFAQALKDVRAQIPVQTRTKRFTLDDVTFAFQPTASGRPLLKLNGFVRGISPESLTVEVVHDDRNERTTFVATAPTVIVAEDKPQTTFQWQSIAVPAKPDLSRDGRLFVTLTGRDLTTGAPLTTKVGAVPSQLPIVNIEPSRNQALAIGDDSLATGAVEVGSLSRFLIALFLAFVGGAFLNVFPCVLPILLLKLRSLATIIDQHQDSPRQVRLPLLAGAAGILSVFLIVGASTAFLKASGEFFGIGMHFQNPVFLTALIALLCLLLASNMNVLTLEMPKLIRSLFVPRTEDRRSHTSSSFATGVASAIFATPCTAPMMGGAVAYGLSQSSLQTMIIFFTLGFGLATPCWILALFPGQTKKVLMLLQNSGKAAAIYKVAVSASLLLAIFWLSGIAFELLGLGDLTRAIMISALVGFAGLTFVKAFRRSRPLGWICLGLVLVILVDMRVQQRPETLAPEPFSSVRLAEYRASATPILVNITAQWCITCKIRDRAVIQPTLPQLKEKQVAYLLGDWTAANRQIEALLQQYQRVGIPFTLVFSERFPEGKVLSQNLSQRELLEAYAPML